MVFGSWHGIRGIADSSFNEHIGGRQPPSQPADTAFNMGLPNDPQKDSVWVDSYASEFSRDIEPSVEAGDTVWNVAASCVQLYKVTTAVLLSPLELCTQNMFKCCARARVGDSSPRSTNLTVLAWYRRERPARRLARPQRPAATRPRPRSGATCGRCGKVRSTHRVSSRGGSLAHRDRWSTWLKQMATTALATAIRASALLL